MENDNTSLRTNTESTDLANAKQEEFSIPVVHEDVFIEKRVVETGKVKIIKKVSNEDQVLNIPLFKEELDIKTVPINQFIETAPEPVRYEGDTMIIPVLKEISVVRMMLVEEVHITKKRIQTQDSQNISVRKEEVTIERIHSTEEPTQQVQDL